ncbi:MAG TPA: DCC1-like thiol-disulfide oxidoreductase family protein [Lichenihabitans sp.]|jgi:predicted DCC family thiol-disulfide oxidoreductase YuxK|nr:DCC1-like thiol-disulfide oxidoreductase family protein [Lichenihabitans sp.]
MARRRHSYRDDPAVPAFRDDRPVIVFDGFCVLCSGTARFVMRHDPHKRFRLLAAQTPLGQALYIHYGLDPQDYDTFVVLKDGRAYFRSAAALEIASTLGAPWSAAGIVRIVPSALRDAVYDLIARNRFSLFGRRESCARPTPGDADRFLA